MIRSNFKKLKELGFTIDQINDIECSISGKFLNPQLASHVFRFKVPLDIKNENKVEWFRDNLSGVLHHRQRSWQAGKRFDVYIHG
jgi:hypothetical protein